MIVNIAKFQEIKKFFSSILSDEYREMDFFIEYNSINAVIEYLNNGYVLNADQNDKLKKVLIANNNYKNNIEELINSNLPEKYIFHVLAESQKNVFINKEELNQRPDIKEWLMKKSDTKIAQILISNWMESFQYLWENKENKEQIKNKITQLKELNEYFSYLPGEDKNNLIKFISNKISKQSSLILNRKLIIKEDLTHLLKLIQQSENKNIIEKDTMTDILKNLSEQGEKEIVIKLEKIQQQYGVLLVEFNDTDKIKKTALSNLYEKHLISIVSQYLDIKKETRNKLVKEKTARDMLLENIQYVEEVGESYLQLLNENKLMDLSAKKEYFSQIKKQW